VHFEPERVPLVIASLLDFISDNIMY